MFEQSLVETTHRVGTRKPTTMLISLGIQVGVIAVVAILPLIYYNVLPASQMMAFLSAPPPPPPPPPPPAPTPKIVVRRLVSEVNTSNQLIAPKTIPHGIDRIVESAPPPPVAISTGGTASNILSAISNMPAPPPPPPPPPPIAVGGSVQAAMCISCPSPSYPPIARQAHIQGEVVLHAIIGKDGLVKDLEVLSGNAMLTGEAVRAVKGWRYHPLELNGQAMEVDTQITVKFTLGGS